MHYGILDFYVDYGFTYSVYYDWFRQILFENTPKEINAGFGYRTTMSMKNKNTWIFAHNYCGKIWYICGLVLLPVSIIVMGLVIGKTKDTVGNVGGILCGIQMVPLIGSIFPTEKALKKNF